MGGEAFWIPAAIAAAGGGVQYMNQSNAQNKENNALIEGISRQNNTQSEALSKVRDATQKIAGSSPQQVQAQQTGDYVKQLRANYAGSKQPGVSSSLAPIAGGSGRYNANVADAMHDTENYGTDTATQMGGIDAAVRQRQNEALDAQTLSTQLGGLGLKSQGENFVDQLRARAAGVQNPWLDIFGKAMQAGGIAAAGGSFGGAAGKGASVKTAFNAPATSGGGVYSAAKALA
jgi:hypothetical protein